MGKSSYFCIRIGNNETTMQTVDYMAESAVQDDLSAEQRAYWSDVIAGASHVPVAPEACLSHEEYWSRLATAVRKRYE